MTDYTETSVQAQALLEKQIPAALRLLGPVEDASLAGIACWEVTLPDGSKVTVTCQPLSIDGDPI